MAYLPSRNTFLGSTLFGALLAAYFYGVVHRQIPGQTLLEDAIPSEFVCNLHNYTTEIISVDPLVIYINDFTSPLESTLLIDAGTPNLATTEVYLHGVKRPSTERTSKSAGLHPSLRIVSCLLSRSRSFLGTLLSPTDDFGHPQIVQYHTGEKFDLHHDWYDSPQMVRDGSRRMFNRVASFFVFLEGECEEGETWFPYLEDGERVVGGGEGKWRRHEDGGLAFRPIEGNAVFWVNLHKNGTGDRRVMHAGLPLKSGRKTAMNIWPRMFY